MHREPGRFVCLFVLSQQSKTSLKIVIFSKKEKKEKGKEDMVGGRWFKGAKKPSDWHRWSNAPAEGQDPVVLSDTGRDWDTYTRGNFVQQVS